MATSQFWYGGSIGGGLSTSAVDFPFVNGDGHSTTEAAAASIVGAAGTLKSLSITLGTAPGTGKSRRFQISVNGSLSTVLDVTISDAATTGTVNGDVAVSAGDVISIACTPSGTPAGSGNVINSLEFLPTTDNYFTYPGFLPLSGTTPAFAPMLQMIDLTDSSDDVGVTQNLCGLSGHIRQLYINLSVAPGTGHSYDYILMINGTEVGSLVNIADTAVAGNQTGLSHVVAAGDILTFKRKAAHGLTATVRTRWAVVIEPDTPGQFMIGGLLNTNLSNSVASYLGLRAYSNNIDTTEAAVQLPAPTLVALPGYRFVAVGMVLGTAPGTGKSRTVLPRIAGASGSISGTISDSATSVIATGSDVISAGQQINLRTLPSGTPTNSGAQAWVAVLAPSSTIVTLDVATAASIGIDHVADVATVAAIADTAIRDVLTAAALSAIVSKDVGSALAASLLGHKDITTAAAIGLPKIWAGIHREIDPADWPSTPTCYLEVHGYTSDPSDPFEAALYNETLGALVPGSTVLITATSKARGRSGAFSLASGPNVYHVVFQEGHPMYDAVLILDVG